MSYQDAIERGETRNMISDMARTMPMSRRKVPDQLPHKTSDSDVERYTGDGGASTGEERWPLPGLAPMTRVRTSFGDVHAIALRKGDEVLVRGGEYLPILWINRINLDEHILTTKPDSNPIVIASGTFGWHGEVLVSPRQVILGDGNTEIPGGREAAMLMTRPGVRRLRETGLSYTMFHVGRSAEVYCEGLFMQFPLET